MLSRTRRITTAVAGTVARPYIRTLIYISHKALTGIARMRGPKGSV